MFAPLPPNPWSGPMTPDERKRYDESLAAWRDSRRTDLAFHVVLAAFLVLTGIGTLGWLLWFQLGIAGVAGGILVAAAFWLAVVEVRARLP